MNDARAIGCQDILIAVVDGLKSFVLLGNCLTGNTASW
jgi:hypothetical protein